MAHAIADRRFLSETQLASSAGMEQHLLMLTSWWRHLPNAISCARLLATPILLFAVGTKNLDLFKWLLMGVPSEISAEELLFRDEVENVLIHPERISSREMLKNSVSVGVVQSAGRAVERQVGIGDAGLRNHTGIETKLPQNPLPLLLTEQRGSKSHDDECKHQDATFEDIRSPLRKGRFWRSRW
jgi:hypothetical protein